MTENDIDILAKDVLNFFSGKKIKNQKKLVKFFNNLEEYQRLSQEAKLKKFQSQKWYNEFVVFYDEIVKVKDTQWILDPQKISALDKVVIQKINSLFSYLNSKSIPVIDSFSEFLTGLPRSVLNTAISPAMGDDTITVQQRDEARLFLDQIKGLNPDSDVQNVIKLLEEYLDDDANIDFE